MKNLLPLVALLALFACSTQSETPSLRQSLLSLTKPKETFAINTNADTIITTASGIIIGIPAHSLVTSNGTPVDQPITIEIIEPLKKSEMILNGISTVSKNQLLESVWMFHIRAISNGQELTAKGGSSLIAAKNIKMDSLSPAIFYGVNNNDIIEWEIPSDELDPQYTEADQEGPGDITLRRNYESLPGTYKLDTNRVSAEFNRLTWINFDKIVPQRDNKSIKIHTTQNHDAQYTIVFENLNSVVTGFFDDSATITTAPLPSGYTVNVLVINYHREQNYFATQRFKTGDTELIDLDPKPISKEDLLKELAKLDEPKK